MNRNEKETFVEDFRRRVEGSDAVYLTDFTGLNVKAMTELRQSLREAGAEYVVVKNRLVRLALEELEVPDITESLTGPTGVVFGHDDVVVSAKAIADFAKEHDDRPVFKIGVVENGVLDAEQIGRLAKLPSREGLLSMVAGALSAPAAALASALEAKIQEAVGLVEALIKERGGGEA